MPKYFLGGTAKTLKSIFSKTKIATYQNDRFVMSTIERTILVDFEFFKECWMTDKYCVSLYTPSLHIPLSPMLRLLYSKVNNMKNIKFPSNGVDKNSAEFCDSKFCCQKFRVYICTLGGAERVGSKVHGKFLIGHII